MKILRLKAGWLPALCAMVMLESCGKDNERQALCPIGGLPFYYSYGGARIMFPTAFTPNGDGRNDIFRPLGVTGISNYFLTIYDQSGNVLLRSSDPYGFGWTGGTNNGIAMPAGRYPVNIQFKTLDGEVVNKDFCVSLLTYNQANCIPRENGETYYFEDQLDPSNPNYYYNTAELLCF